MDTFTPEAGALLQRQTATAGGLTLGSRLTIPPGSAGVVVKDGKIFDTLPPGDYGLDAATLPLLMQKVKPRFGPGEATPLPAAVFLVQTGSPVSLPWAGQAILSKSAAYGLTYMTLQGRCLVQVADPARFCGVVLNAAGKALAGSGVSPGQAAEHFLRANLQTQAGEAVKKMNLPPEQAMGAKEAIRAAVGQAAAQWLYSVGLHCHSFDLESLSEPDLAPCAGCHSYTVPTAYAIFRRTISLIYLRFTAKQEGNFCVPCALKISAGYNSVMLVCGWWGYIGIVMTPIYFSQNLYHMARVAFGPKSVPRHAQAALMSESVGGEGVWPPPPKPG